MFNKNKGTAASVISVVAFVVCCAVMLFNFRLWYLPVAALPFLIVCNINYKGAWESKQVDDYFERQQEEEPYSKTWPFNALEEEPADSPRQEVQNREERRERKWEEQARREQEREQIDRRYQR